MKSTHNRVLVVTDNKYLFGEFSSMLTRHDRLGDFQFEYTCSPQSRHAFDGITGIRPLPSPLKEMHRSLAGQYSLIISMHCKSLFPSELVQTVRCVNVHPGLNPFNRGWFPQVFSLINGLPIGATIHEMDEQLDHGPIICQQQVPVYEWDTSKTLYERVLEAELNLLDEHIESIVKGTYRAMTPQCEGNLNMIADFKSLCELDLNKMIRLGDAINLLRALTHEPYQNAWFRSKNGDKVVVGIVTKHIPKDIKT